MDDNLDPENEAMPDGDRNIQVRCVSCKTVYVTAVHGFEKRGNRCPTCKSSKAQALEG